MSDVLLPVLSTKRLRSWPKHANGGRIQYLPLRQLLVDDYTTDAHFGAYSVPSRERRLCLDLLRDAEVVAEVGGCVPMVLAVFDVDCQEAHGGASGDVDAWWIDELEKIQALLDAHPGGFVYRTRGGYRVLYRLSDPFELRTVADADAWSLLYLTWVAYLERRFAIVADPSCREWVRIFRLPHATRDVRSGPERRETIGDAEHVAAWACQPSDEDRAKAGQGLRKKPGGAKRRARRHAPAEDAPAEGVLKLLFAERGWLGDEVAPDTWAAQCPNAAQHTMGEDLDGSTVIFPPYTGEIFGHLHCRHAHCATLTLRDVLRCFAEDEIKAAKDAVRETIPSGIPATESAGQDRDEGDLVSVLIPGQHHSDDGPVEVSTDQFARAVLNALPPGALYRMDFLVGQIVGPQGERQFSEVDDTAMRMIVDRHVRLCSRRRDKEGGVHEVYVPCGRDLAGLVRSAAGCSHAIRCLRQLIAHPVYLPGFELAVPGWNATGGVFYDEPPDLRDLTPRPDGAFDVLRELLIDWPFEDEASRENTYGMMLTAVLRPAIEGPIPFHLVIASIDRTGKGKLIDTALGYAVRGKSVEMMQIGTSEAEREKRITGLLLRSASAVHFDNIATDQILDSASIASLATAYPNWGGRILGSSRTPQLPNNGTYVMSANNPSASSEVSKRQVPIVLQPFDDKPHLRKDFAHPDCFAYAKERRRAVLEALLGIVEAWKQAGRPFSNVAMGGFERWTEAVGGALRHAGASAWMTNYTRWVSTADDTQTDIEILVDAWAEQFRTAEVTAAQLLSIVEKTGAFRWVLSRPSRAGQIVALGRKVLKPLTNRPVRGWIVRRSATGSSASYSLERFNLSSSPGRGEAASPDASAPDESSNGREYSFQGERRERGTL